MSAQTSRSSSPGSTQRDRVHLSSRRSRARQRPSKRKHGLCAQVGRHDGIEHAAFPHITAQARREKAANEKRSESMRGKRNAAKDKPENSRGSNDPRPIRGDHAHRDLAKRANIVDEGQAAGVIAKHGGHTPKEPPDSGGSRPATLEEIGVSQQRLSEARLIRDTYKPKLEEEARKRKARAASESNKRRSTNDPVRQKVAEPSTQDERRSRTEAARIAGTNHTNVTSSAETRGGKRVKEFLSWPTI